jgi:ribosome-dependent ATPase
MFLMALFVFQVPLKALPHASGRRLLYVTTTTSWGMLIQRSPARRSPMFGTIILTVLPATQFSGMLVPVSALTGWRSSWGADSP